MKEKFPGHFANAEADIKSLWDTCIFVLDANVLLNLYRYSDSTRSDLLKIFESLSDRVWAPHQVVHEYLTNRLNVIGQQVKFYDDTIKDIGNIKKTLENSNQNPFVSSEILTEANLTFDKLSSELAENRSTHQLRITQDDIKANLESLLSGKVGDSYPRERVEEILTEGKDRYAEKTPPGFGDIKKGGDSTLFQDRCRPYGDLIAWLQILDKSKSEKKGVIFVTGDVKEDWWVVFQGKTVGPHPALVDEFKKTTECDFYMYTPDIFLERASSFLNQAASELSVQEIRDIQKEDESDHAIFDMAINRSWPSSKPTGLDLNQSEIARSFASQELEDYAGELVDLPWNDPITKEYLVMEEHTRMERLRSLQADAIKLQVRKAALQAYMRDHHAHGSSAGKDERSFKQLHDIQRHIEMLEMELKVLREPRFS